MGARPLRRTIQEEIEDKLTDYYLDNPSVKQFIAKIDNDKIIVTKAEDQVTPDKAE